MAHSCIKRRGLAGAGVAAHRPRATEGDAGTSPAFVGVELMVKGLELPTELVTQASVIILL